MSADKVEEYIEPRDISLGQKLLPVFEAAGADDELKQPEKLLLLGDR